MPRNRQDIPREEKVAVLTDIAARLFVERGFDGTSVTEIAALAGVKSNAVYWYFPTKDHLLAQVMDRAAAAELARIDALPDRIDGRERLIQFLTGLQPYRGLHNTIHERMRTSEVARESHDRMVDGLRRLIDRALEPQPPHVDRTMVVDVIVAAFEGTNVDPEPRRSGVDVVSYLLEDVFADADRRTR